MSLFLLPRNLLRETLTESLNTRALGGYVKQMREETEKFKITDKNCLDREQYWKMKLK